MHPFLMLSIPIANLICREEMPNYTPQSTLQECPSPQTVFPILMWERFELSRCWMGKFNRFSVTGGKRE